MRDELTILLGQVRRRLRRLLLLRGVAWTLLAVALAALASLAVDKRLDLTRPQRVIILLLAAAGAAQVVRRRLVRPLRSPLAEAEMALLLERQYPELQDRLITAVQLAGSAEESSPMAAAVTVQAVQACAKLDPCAPLDLRGGRRHALVALAVVAVVAGLCLWQPRVAKAWVKRNLLLMQARYPRLTMLSVQGGPSFRIARGGNLAITVGTEGSRTVPDSVLVTTEYGGPRQVERVALQGTTYRHTFANVTQGFRFHIAGGDDRTEWQSVEVFEPPVVVELTGRKVFPPYLGRPEETLKQVQGFLSLRPGGFLELAGKANKPLYAGRLVRQDFPPIELRVQGQSFTATLPAGAVKAATNSRLELELTDTDGVVNAQAGSWMLRIEPDEPPVVTLGRRSQGSHVTPQARLRLQVDARDDSLVTGAALVVERAGAASQPSPATQEAPGVLLRQDLPLPAGPAAQVRLEALAGLAVLPLEVGQSIQVYAQAKDNLPPDLGGPNIGASQAMTFQLVSPQELMADLLARQKQIAQDLALALELQTQLVERLTAATTRVDAGAAPATLQGSRPQRQVGSQVEQDLANLRSVVEEMGDNALIPPETQSALGQRLLAPLQKVQEAIPAQVTVLEGLEAAPNSPAATWHAALRSATQTRDQLQAVLAELKRQEDRQELARALRRILQESQQIQRDLQKKMESQSPFDRPAPEEKP